jgi:aldoxime dehydratase
MDLIMESAIAKQLICPRSRTRRIDDDFTPPYPAWTARGDAKVSRVVMAYFGVQWDGDTRRGAAIAALQEIDVRLKSGDGPAHHDFAHYVDEAGFDTLMAVAYWTDIESYKRWWTQPDLAKWWLAVDQSKDGLGYFREVASPRVEHFETLYSTPDGLEGIGTALGVRSDDQIQEHSYWGSARDRIPLAQTDAMEPSGNFSAQEENRSPRHVRLSGHSNVALIRSGQDWTATKARERDLYLDEIEPALRAGMTYLRDQGQDIGCYINRYLTQVDSAGNPLEKTYGLSYWRSLADMEKWAEHHPTHLAIFGTFMKTVQALEFQLDLRLDHEVCVLAPDEQEYEYINCHNRTGLLNAIPRSNIAA